MVLIERESWNQANLKLSIPKNPSEEAELQVQIKKGEWKVCSEIIKFAHSKCQPRIP